MPDIALRDWVWALGRHLRSARLTTGQLVPQPATGGKRAIWYLTVRPQHAEGERNHLPLRGGGRLRVQATIRTTGSPDYYIERIVSYTFAYEDAEGEVFRYDKHEVAQSYPASHVHVRGIRNAAGRLAHLPTGDCDLTEVVNVVQELVSSNPG